MTEEEVKTKFKRHLGQDWEIWLSRVSHECISMQVKKGQIQFHLVFNEKKSHRAAQMLTRLSRVFQEYGISCNLVINTEKLL